MPQKELKFNIHLGKYVHYSFHASDGRVKGSTGIQAPNGIENLPLQDKNKLGFLSVEINRYIASQNFAMKPLLKRDVQAIIDEIVKGKSRSKSTKVIDLLTRYYESAKDGKINSANGDKFSIATVHTYRTIKNNMPKHSPFFCNKNVSELQRKDFLAMQSDLVNANLSKNSISTYNSNIIAIISGAYELGWHDNDLHKKEKSLWYHPEIVDHAIYYNIDELKSFYAHRYESDVIREARDLFVFGCFTCLRHFDLSTANFKDAYSKVNNTLDIKTHKKKKKVIIPLHPIALEILEMYDFNFMHCSRERLSDKIKKAAKLAGFTQPCRRSITKGGKLHRDYVPKYKLTAPHTMRRSFATNAFLAGVPTQAIMSIGGWTSETSFRRYLRITQEDLARLAAQNSFYKGW